MNRRLRYIRLKWFIATFFVLILAVASDRQKDISNNLSDGIGIKTEVKEPLSVRNNNPVNIKYFKVNKWEGSVYQSGTFEKFKTKEYGMRAGYIVILANIKATDSVEQFVLRFASEPNESMKDVHISNYVKHLQKELGYSHKIRVEDTFKVMKVIIQREGGQRATEYYKRSLK